MNESRNPSTVSIRTSELYDAAHLTVSRGDNTSAERRRIASVQAWLASAADLNQTLSDFLRHSVVHSQGSPGTSDLFADTAALAEALATFAEQLDRVAVEARDARPRPRIEGAFDVDAPASEPNRMRSAGGMLGTPKGIRNR